MDWPRSLLFIAAVPVLMLLQMLPFIGGILMFLGIAFAPILFVNLGFGGILVETFVRRLSLSWLILPVVWFGGYEAWVVAERMDIARQRAEALAAGQSSAIPFNAASQALVLDYKLNAQILLLEYGLPVVYSSGGAPNRPYAAFRLASRPVCEDIGKDPANSQAKIFTRGVHERYDDITNATFNPSLCVVETPESPRLPQLRVTVPAIPGQDPYFRTADSKLEIRTPDGTGHELSAGMVYPLPWIPMPVIGCGWTAKSPGEQCTARFYRPSAEPLVTFGHRYDSEIDQVAFSLGLKPIAPAQRKLTPAEDLRRVGAHL